jgi:hypothetical protein
VNSAGKDREEYQFEPVSEQAHSIPGTESPANRSRPFATSDLRPVYGRGKLVAKRQPKAQTRTNRLVATALAGG